MRLDIYQIKRDRLDRYGLQPHEEWPLFGIEKRISPSDGNVWVWLTSLPPLDGHRDGLRRLLGEIRRLEYRCESEGIAGWLQAIRRENRSMCQWAEMIGAEIYAEDDDFWYLKKEAGLASLPATVKEAVSRYHGGHHYGRA
ncbi:MAG: hypothetical protein OEY86_00830 [Nitrospira sp.]|nr:hypothetical protein [Nitrospira sp.]